MVRTEARSKGNVTFVRHMISDTLWTKNAGNVAFSEPHGDICADINGDGIPDFVVGKRYWTHFETIADPDPYGSPVLYWYETVRDPKAPGGARFVPHMIDNRRFRLGHPGSGFESRWQSRYRDVDTIRDIHFLESLEAGKNSRPRAGYTLMEKETGMKMWKARSFPLFRSPTTVQILHRCTNNLDGAKHGQPLQTTHQSVPANDDDVCILASPCRGEKAVSNDLFYFVAAGYLLCAL